MTSPRHDRIIPLTLLRDYPDSPWLDMRFFLPPADDARRRVWLLTPESAPTIAINDTPLEPRRVSSQSPRWIDYGVAKLPLGFSQLRIRGMKTAECACAFLLITARLDFSPEGCPVERAEEALWGLARRDAGATTLRPSRVTVGAPAAFHARYRAGAKGLPAGALVRFAVPKAMARPQTDRPEAPGYVTVTEADAGVTVETVEVSVESHEMVDILCRLEEPLAAGQGFTLRYLADWNYIYPHRFVGVDRPYWFAKLPPMAAAVAVSPSSPFVSLAEENGHAFEVHSGPPERLHLFLPGRRFATERLSLKATFTDRYRNIPQRGPVDARYELSLVGGGERIALGTPAGRFVAHNRFQVPLPALRPGVYRAVARRSGSDEPVAQSNPLEIIDARDAKRRVYWGEIHGHTEMSDGCGAYGELYRHAREDGALDFAAAADHACYFSDNEWLWMQDVTNSWNRAGEFVTLAGYEWAGKQVHRNVYTSRDRVTLFRGMYEPTSNINTVWEHFHGDEEVVAGPHGVLAHGIVWEHHDPEVERFVEIYSMWGAGECRDNPLVPEWLKDVPRDHDVNGLLRSGAHLGFTGGGDCHEGHVGFTCEDPDGQGATPHTFAAVLLYRCGMTAAELPEFGRRELIRALRNRRTYATTGARILLHFTAADYAMGAVGTADEVTCRAEVHAVAPLKAVEIVKDGAVAWSRQADGLEARVDWQDPDAPTREHVYYLRVTQVDGQMAWSSPVWVGPR